MIRDGKLIRAELTEIAHGERSPRDFDKRGFNSWFYVSTSMWSNTVDYLKAERPAVLRQ